MSIYEDVDFIEQQVRLNNHEFRKCRFLRCHLLFDATQPSVIVGCSFQESTLHLEGAASDTMVFLSAMYEIKGFGDVAVRKIFNKIAGRSDQFNTLF